MGRGATFCLPLQCARAGMGMPYEEEGMMSRGRPARWAAARAVAEARSGHGVRADKNQLYELSSILRRASIGFSRVPTFPTLPALEGRARRRAPLVALAAV